MEQMIAQHFLERFDVVCLQETAASLQYSQWLFSGYCSYLCAYFLQPTAQQLAALVTMVLPSVSQSQDLRIQLRSIDGICPGKLDVVLKAIPVCIVQVTKAIDEALYLLCSSVNTGL